MKFHAPSSPWYARTNAEVWFRTAEAAEAAGFANAETGDASEPRRRRRDRRGLSAHPSRRTARLSRTGTPRRTPRLT